MAQTSSIGHPPGRSGLGGLILLLACLSCGMSQDKAPQGELIQPQLQALLPQGLIDATPRDCGHFRRPHGRARGFMSFTNRLRTVVGVNHSGQDVVALPGQDVPLLAQFAYGPLAFRLVDEEVQTFVHNCHRWMGIRDSRTDSSGRVRPQAPVRHLLPGTYAVGYSVVGDGSTAHSKLFILPPGQHFVVFNIDGTLTSAPPASFYSAVGAQAYYSQLADKLAPGLREDAAELTRLWADKGYQILYLTARPLHLRGITESWLRTHDFAEGILHLSEASLDLLPYNSCVGTYKARVLNELQELGHHLDVAYGATTTDMYAYKRAGVSQLFAVGFLPMEDIAVRLDFLGGHLESVNEFGASVDDPP
jgi:hypothetical protein